MFLNPLKINHHIQCHSRFLGLLPAKFQSEDSNTLAIAYFSLSSLELLNALDTVFTHSEKRSLTNYIYKHLIETDNYAGFCGSLTYLPHNESSIELAATCFALQSLIVLKDDLHRVPIHKIIRTIQECQTEDGGFTNTLTSAHTFSTNEALDLRYCMIATTIIKLLLRDTTSIAKTIDVNSLITFISNLQNIDGGYGMRSGDESHAGMVFCAVDALAMISDNNQHYDNNEALIDFLVHRQIWYDEYNKTELSHNAYADIADNGGFNGRLNKAGDTCYVFWTLAALNICSKDSLINKEAAEMFLLNGTQNNFMGGFNKTANSDELPDPLHSFLGLAALSILGHEKVGKINTQFVLPESSYKHWQSLSLS